MSNRENVLEMINAAWMCQAIGVACALGIPDRIAGGTGEVRALASTIGASEEGVKRLLRALTTLGLARSRDDATFTLTADGTLLTTHAEESLHAWAVMNATRGWAAWTHLAEGVRTGRNVRGHTGLDGYAEFRAGEASSETFNRAMRVLTRPVALGLRDKIAFTGSELAVDIGGGGGHLLMPLLESHPEMRAIVFDLEHARPLAEETMAAQGVRDRCRFVPGSFFDGVPQGDVHFLKSVLHNWDDARAIEILRRCREAMAPGTRLLILERIVAPAAAASAIDRENARSDLQMMLACDGRERSEREFRSLLSAAALEATAITPLTPLVSAIEARAA